MMNDEVCGEIENPHPGYLCGNNQGSWRIYQQTFVDTHSKWAGAKLYTAKTPITAAELLNDRVLPFFASLGDGRHPYTDGQRYGILWKVNARL